MNLWARPYIIEPLLPGYDVHAGAEARVDRQNRLACELTNARNARTHANYEALSGYKLTRPYHHYDALSGRALVFDVPNPPEQT